ncbi:hypothetical protein J5N97_018096 [Dioscorea zingiberensis]|uniref:Uncharacterized protein n=1 Tax=Dioscorea zingiberensis TaxID=325984 RepID=A0A9D5CMJ8_9LILI|nr:hypothetical protein J5N97_018096 [Dioscorea zingiberensis]
MWNRMRYEILMTIGYDSISFEDPVTKYVGRGVSGGDGRFVFASQFMLEGICILLTQMTGTTAYCMPKLSPSE